MKKDKIELLLYVVVGCWLLVVDCRLSVVVVVATQYFVSFPGLFLGTGAHTIHFGLCDASWLDEEQCPEGCGCSMLSDKDAMPLFFC